MKNTSRRKFVKWLTKLPVGIWILSQNQLVAKPSKLEFRVFKLNSDTRTIQSELTKQEIHDLKAFLKPRECRGSFPEWNGLRIGCLEFRDGQWINWKI